METTREIISLFRNSCLVRILQKSDSKRHPFQDEDHPGNDPHLFPGSPYSNSGISPEHLRGELGLVGSEKNSSS